MPRSDIWELDRVILAVPVWCDEGKEIPAGSRGTVVGIWAKGTAFEVEFIQPFEALATVCACDLKIEDKPMKQEAIEAAETLKRQMTELMSLQKSHDWMVANATILDVHVSVANAGPNRTHLTHHEFTRFMRTHLREIMDRILLDQRALCDATHARLTEAMGIKPDLGEMLGEEPVSVATSVSVTDGFPYENKA